MNSIKKCSGVINSNKNKLNCKINWFFNLKPNTHLCFLVYMKTILVFF